MNATPALFRYVLFVCPGRGRRKQSSCNGISWVKLGAERDGGFDLSYMQILHGGFNGSFNIFIVAVCRLWREHGAL